MTLVAPRTPTESFLRWLLALAFAVAAGLKLGNTPGAETMFSVLPTAVRVALVAVELSLAGLLVSRYFRRLSAIGTTFLLCMFLAAILHELTRPNPRPCGCFGTPINPASADATRHLLWLTLTLDALLLTAALYLSFMPRPRRSTSP